MPPDDVFPKVTPRRPFEEDQPDGYRESDRDFVMNNLEAAVWLLEHATELNWMWEVHLISRRMNGQK